VAGFFLSSEQTFRYLLVISFFRIFDEIYYIDNLRASNYVDHFPKSPETQQPGSKYAYQAQEKQATGSYSQHSKDVFKGEL
jgi:hypothetical protein